MIHQPDEPREEALRLAKEADLNEVDVWAHDPHPDNDKWILSDNDLVRLIALARASQAQPPAGWEQDAKRYRWLREHYGLHNLNTAQRHLFAAGYDVSYVGAGQALDVTIDAAIAAAPSPITGEKE